MTRRLPVPIRNLWYHLTRCRATPYPGMGGYQHWYCQHPRGHATKRTRGGLINVPGPVHRYRNYVWSDRAKVKHDPLPLDIRSLVPWDGELSIKPRTTTLPAIPDDIRGLERGDAQ